jgi:uncharacterized membrane protein (GlpM family)
LGIRPLEMLFDIAWKTLATALAVVLVAKLGERGGALIASVVMTFPMNAGPGFFFVALDQSAGFVSHGALVSLSVTGAVLGFVAVYVLVGRVAGFALSLALAILAWGAGAAVTVALPPTLGTAGLMIALGILLVTALGTTKSKASPTTLMRAGWGHLLARGALAGTLVAGVAQFAGVLGSTVAGLAYAFPTMMVASMWVLHRHYGPDFALATMARVPAGLLTYGGFCLALHLAAGPLEPLAAWSLAVVAAVAIATVRALTGRPARRPSPGTSLLPQRPPWAPGPIDR